MQTVNKNFVLYKYAEIACLLIGLSLVAFFNNKQRIADTNKTNFSIADNANFLYDRTIDTHIKNIRHKVGDDVILTVRGIGYKSF